MAGLYFHIPFCEHKCIYCDFYSIAPGEKQFSHQMVTRFLASVNREIALRGECGEFQSPFETIFFGGGTPSLLSPSNIKEVLETAATTFSLTAEAEITLETNPGTVNVEKLCGFRAAGVNRLSIGIQSFHDDDLRFLTRIHSSDEAKNCVRRAFQAGFKDVSLDLIFAIPGQTPERWRSNLEQAIDLAPTHISCYSLIVEPSTPLQRLVQSRQVALTTQEADSELYRMTIDILADHGYKQYEVSNFARDGFVSRHNLGYWDHSPYLGFGPSAHSFWNGQRWWNVSNVAEYSEKIEQGFLPVAGSEILTERQLRNEEVFLGLRSSGIDVAGFRKRHDHDLLVDYQPAVARLLDDGMAVYDGQVLRLTSKGYALCDEICQTFLV